MKNLKTSLLALSLLAALPLQAAETAAVPAAIAQHQGPVRIAVIR
ncbi:sugar ABC transporter substrate-binding protein, partial [Serratia marcescens]